MNDALFVGAILLVFFVGPVLGVFMVVKDVARSRAKGRELDDLENLVQGLRGHVDLLRTRDLAWFHASLSDWLEQYIRSVNTGWVRGCARLLIEVKAIGLGEESRAVLRQDTDRRNRVLMRIRRVVEAIEDGTPEVILERSGDLLAFFLCHGDSQETKHKMELVDSATVLRRALAECAELIQSGLIQVNPVKADEAIRDGLLALTRQGYSNTCGVPILILKWASIRLWSAKAISFRTSKPLSNVLQNLANQFIRVSDAYASGDLAKVADIVYSSI